MATPASPLIVNPDPAANFDPEKFKGAGYSSDEIQGIQRALSAGYSVKDIDSAFQKRRAITSVPDAAQPESSFSDSVINFLRPMVRPIVSGGLAGMAATAALPLTGPAGSAAAGLGTYAATDLALKQAMGESKPTTAEDLKDTATSGVVNETGSTVLRGLGGLLSRIPTAARVLKRGQELATQVTGGRPVADATDPYYLASSLKTKVENAANAFQNPPQVFSKNALTSLLQEEGQGSPLISKIQQIIRDPAKIQDVLDAGGVRIPIIGKVMSGNPRQDLAGFALTQLMRRSPKEALAELGDINNAESYKKLFSQQTRSNLEQLFKAGAAAESVAKFANYTPKVTLGIGGLHLAASLFTGHLSPFAASEIAMSGVWLGGKALAKVASNTPLSRALTSIAEGTASGMSDQAISRMLVGALQGTGAVIGMTDAKGNETKGTVESGPNGSQFVPLKPAAAVDQPFVAP